VPSDPTQPGTPTVTTSSIATPSVTVPSVADPAPALVPAVTVPGQ
jgi:hypothetical protein